MLESQMTKEIMLKTGNISDKDNAQLKRQLIDEIQLIHELYLFT